MKLAEALAERSDAQRRLEQLRDRARKNARYQEGEEPSEDAMELLVEAKALADRVEELVRAINRTNSATALEPGVTITDAIAKRDALKSKHSLVTTVAEAASGDHYSYRQMRSELRYISAVSVADLHKDADSIALELRMLDTRIQEKNWTVDLIE